VDKIEILPQFFQRPWTIKIIFIYGEPCSGWCGKISLLSCAIVVDDV